MVAPNIKSIQGQIKKRNRPTNNNSTVIQMQQAQNNIQEDYNPIRIEKSIFSCFS